MPDTVLLSSETHKQGNLFWVAIKDKDTCQRHVARYLQLHLGKLLVEDPYMVPGSQEVIALLKKNELVMCVPVNMKDMY